MRMRKETKRSFLLLMSLSFLGAPVLSSCDTPSATLKIQDATYTLSLGYASSENPQEIKECTATLTPSDKAAFDNANGKNIFFCKADQTYHAVTFVVTPLEGEAVSIDLLYDGTAPGPDRYEFGKTPSPLFGGDHVRVQWMLQQQDSSDPSLLCDHIACSIYTYKEDVYTPYYFHLFTRKAS
jgi:hypothetical protein